MVIIHQNANSASKKAGYDSFGFMLPIKKNTGFSAQKIPQVGDFGTCPVSASTASFEIFQSMRVVKFVVGTDWVPIGCPEARPF